MLGGDVWIHAKVQLILTQDYMSGEREGSRRTDSREGRPARNSRRRPCWRAECVHVTAKSYAPSAADMPAADHCGGAEVGGDDLRVYREGSGYGGVVARLVIMIR